MMESAGGTTSATTTPAGAGGSGGLWTAWKGRSGWILLLVVVVGLVLGAQFLELSCVLPSPSTSANAEISTLDEITLVRDHSTNNTTTPPTPAPSPEPPADNRKVAVVVTKGDDRTLALAVLSVIANAPSDWKVQIFHSRKYEEQIKNDPALVRHIQLGKVILTPEVPDNMGYGDYQNIFRNVTFWEHVQGEHILVFQSDTIMCKNSPYSLDDFLQFDYIGAPYPNGVGWERQNCKCGNGGFSLRKRSKQIELLDSCLGQPWPYSNEDIWFCHCYCQLIEKKWPYKGKRGVKEENQEFTFRLPNREEYLRFAVETVYSDRKPMALHIPDRASWMKVEDIGRLVDYCPEVCGIMPRSLDARKYCVQLLQTQQQQWL